MLHTTGPTQNSAALRIACGSPLCEMLPIRKTDGEEKRKIDKQGCKVTVTKIKKGFIIVMIGMHAKIYALDNNTTTFKFPDSVNSILITTCKKSIENEVPNCEKPDTIPFENETITTFYDRITSGIETFYNHGLQLKKKCGESYFDGIIELISKDNCKIKIRIELVNCIVANAKGQKYIIDRKWISFDENEHEFNLILTSTLENYLTSIFNADLMKEKR